MRTFVTWQFWLALLALGGLWLALGQFTGRSQISSLFPEAIGVPQEQHQIDLIAPVFLVQADPGTQIRDGTTTGRIQVRVDGFRYMNIAPGTPGENRCSQLDQLAKCVVAADLLGEAVLWFAFIPAEPKNEVSLPPIVELHNNAQVLLRNGWLVRRAEVVQRVCDTESTSLTDFVRALGADSVTTFSLDIQGVSTVTCANTSASTTGSTTTVSTPRGSSAR
jgi:hypothetical protein